MNKNYVLDTNVLLYDANSLYKFEENDIYIPLVVLEELDSFKKRMDEIGINAREVARILDVVREKGKLKDGVVINDKGGKVFVTNKSLQQIVPDKEILNTTKDIMDKYKRKKTILVTKDINLRVRAEAYDIKAEDYKKSKDEDESTYMGHKAIELDGDLIDLLNSSGSLEGGFGHKLYNNEYLHITNNAQSTHTCIAKYLNGNIVKIKNSYKIANISPKNLEQTFALNALMDDNIKMVTINGKSGSGKTLLALASAIHQLTSGNYNKITVTRPVVPVGNDIGFIPGGIEEKMEPWIKPIRDAMETIRDSDSKANQKSMVPFNIEDDMEVLPLTYIRGRSIPNAFMIIDESQNLSPLEIKTIVTRVGEGTKLVFTGDTDQIDHPYMDAKSNGLTHLISKFRDADLYAHITLLKGERSRLAEMASKIL